MTREEAIKDIEENIKPYVGGKSLDMAIEALKQPEQKKGKWIDHPHEAGPYWDSSLYECSECHQWVECSSDYCPTCGAKMDEE